MVVSVLVFVLASPFRAALAACPPFREVTVDPRYKQLAEIMAGFSTKVEPGDHVLLQTDVSTPHDMNRAVIEAVRERGGVMLAPIIWDQRLMAASRRGCTAESLGVDARAYLETIRGTKVRIALRGYTNPLEMSAVPGDDQQRYDKEYVAAVIDESVENTRWVLSVWPTTGFAYMAGLSTTEAEEMFFGAVLADYPAMERSVQPLKKLMDQTNQVQILGPGETSLYFSIKGIGGVPCVGHRNIPDGEVYTAPVRDSMNGVISYNTLTITKSGERFEGVWFQVKQGKIIASGCRVGDPKRIEQILNTDEGARYFGEWSLGLNWGIQRIIGDTLFDEKVGGTFHLTPGKAYSNADNGNRSGIHWDIVCDQRESAGGGQIYFDGRLVRKNGLFVLPELAGLNPKVDTNVVREVLSQAFDPTIGPLRPDEVNEEAVAQILTAATDPSIGPVRPDEIDDRAVHSVLTAVHKHKKRSKKESDGQKS